MSDIKLAIEYQRQQAPRPSGIAHLGWFIGCLAGLLSFECAVLLGSLLLCSNVLNQWEGRLVCMLLVLSPEILAISLGIYSLMQVWRRRMRRDEMEPALVGIGMAILWLAVGYGCIAGLCGNIFWIFNANRSFWIL